MLDSYGQHGGGDTFGRRELPLGVMLVQLDWLLVAAIAGVVAFGLWAIAGVTAHNVSGQTGFLGRQQLYAGVGGVVFLFAAALSPEIYRRFWRVFYCLALLMLALVPLLGVKTLGSQRWLQIGTFQFQPSEFAKPLILIALAGFLAERGRSMRNFSTLIGVFILVAIPSVLVFIQPDFGTALVYGAITAAALLIAGTPWRQLAALAAVVAIVSVLVLSVLPSLGVQVLKKYQQDRLTGFFHPSSDPAGATYNITQSKIALGAGGLHGRGTAASTQTNSNFLPTAESDFILAATGEQRGFVGLSILLGLYLLVVWRGLRALVNAADGYRAVLAAGIVFAFLFQIFINAGMEMGIAPITGIPLPLVSAGGSAMIANLAALGILVGIQMRGEGSRRRLR